MLILRTCQYFCEKYCGYDTSVFCEKYCDDHTSSLHFQNVSRIIYKGYDYVVNIMLLIYIYVPLFIIHYSQLVKRSCF